MTSDKGRALIILQERKGLEERVTEYIGDRENWHLKS